MRKTVISQGNIKTRIESPGSLGKRVTQARKPYEKSEERYIGSKETIPLRELYITLTPHQALLPSARKLKKSAWNYLCFHLVCQEINNNTALL